MVIVSKFDGHCKVCDGRTFKGDRVVWIKGQKGVSHPACHVGAQPQRVVQVAVAEPKPEIVEIGGGLAAEIVEPKAEPEVLKNPRDPKELCSFLTSLSDEQLHALKAIVETEQERRNGLTRDDNGQLQRAA